ncbi:MAG: CRISPR-associated protein [Bacteroidales bacterium]|jgi:CRISPR/Cas system CSM-associated protein Csm3 (group 7 of RAMP superfamily)|nr:CRISPR-associated protein [Bacteroidales bacterium]
MKDVIKFSGYNHRFLARFVIEAETPLAVGSGEKDILTDALVATDVNGLPYIPGTAIAGVVRHMIEEVKPEDFNVNQIFGFQDKKEGQGSEIIFTEAKILNSNGEVIDGMDLKAKDDSLLRYYAELPIRQHVRINEKGVTDKAGKFDEQVIFAGTRFCFEIEMVAKEAKDEVNFQKALEQIQSKTFRIGGGTRSGFGEIKVIKLYKRSLYLKQANDLELYLSKSSNLSEEWCGWEKHDILNDNKADGWITYELKLQPEDFFLFGSGFGDDEVDMTPVKEKKVVWKDAKGELSEELVLIPATSVKGALAHRVAFHYNRLKERFAGCTGDKEPKVGNENEAVQALFGYENQKEKKQVRGNLLFSDVIEDKSLEDKILNHVAIDRFTGGAIDGALFSEKTTYGKGQEFTLTILAKCDALKGDKIQDSLEAAMIDICKGMLPLGGGVNRGNGVFTGSLTKDGNVIYEQSR